MIKSLVRSALAAAVVALPSFSAAVDFELEQLRASVILAQAGPGGTALPGRAANGAQAMTSLPGEGPAAALAFERALRGLPNPQAPRDYWRYPKRFHRYPDANPADLSSLKNFTPMKQGLAMPEELARDFAAKANREQTAILVMVKTEFCHSNQYRVCSVVTASIEKRSTPILRRFRAYVAWIKGNPMPQGDEKWEESVIDRYKFEQGPGATIVAFIPGDNKLFRTDAVEMELELDKFEARGGATPKFEEFLTKVLQSAGTNGTVKR